MDRLPAELLLQIMGDNSIKKTDLRQLRLVSRQVSAAATSRLFARISMSKLHSDREAFFNIAAQPHLSAAVRSVTWLELAEDDTDLPYIAYPPAWRLRLPRDRVPTADDADDFDFLLRRLPPMARALFWLPFENFKSYRRGTEKRTEAIRAFMPDFFAALDQMPNLREFASRPMHPARKLVQPSGLSTPLYPLTCQTFRQSKCKKTMQRNDGFCTFIIPYIAHRVSLGTDTLAPITRLYLVDEGEWSFVPRINPGVVNSFRNLKHLELCISHCQNLRHLKRLGRCLGAATALEELRLCFERDAEIYGSEVFDLIFQRRYEHPRLRDITLVAVPFSALQILLLINRTASSLKRLTFDNCAVPGRLIYALQLIPNLWLESFASVSATVLHEAEDELENTIWLMTEAHALSVIRGQSMFDGAFELGQAIAGRTIYLYTHFYAPSLLRSSCFDRHNHLPQPVVEYLEVKDCDDANYNGDGWEDDGTDTEEASGSDDGLADAPPDLVRNIDGSDSHDSGSDPASHKETAADASIQKMLDTAPRWEFGIGRDGTACCWRVTAVRSSHQGYPTRLWRFFHRNGEQAIGDEPLEFWDDWEGSQSGDTYEPTPFGRDLYAFTLKHGLEGVTEVPREWEAKDMGDLLKEPPKSGQGR
ncbi:hypothetical protein CCMA1212_007457 [Trichoderma ghanense]|uniref:F-box domain-containing protein n=1 Tax=Trichoderma ghanense TaxID=65468 RepID=A0ABY2GZS5_9HYPO